MQEERKEEHRSVFEDLKVHLKEFISTKINYYKLVAFEKVATITPNIVVYSLLGIFGLFFLIFLSISLAILIGNALNNMFLGFIIITAAYLLLCILIFLFKKQMIIDPLANLLIKAMTSDDKSDKE
jgi:phosphoglycerol transferase MdoB-like AlkP superfamily enzyme